MGNHQSSGTAKENHEKCDAPCWEMAGRHELRHAVNNKAIWHDGKRVITGMFASDGVERTWTLWKRGGNQCALSTTAGSETTLKFIGFRKDKTRLRLKPFGRPGAPSAHAQIPKKFLFEMKAAPVGYYFYQVLAKKYLFLNRKDKPRLTASETAAGRWILEETETAAY